MSWLGSPVQQGFINYYGWGSLRARPRGSGHRLVAAPHPPPSPHPRAQELGSIDGLPCWAATLIGPSNPRVRGSSVSPAWVLPGGNKCDVAAMGKP